MRLAWSYEDYGETLAGWSWGQQNQLYGRASAVIEGREQSIATLLHAFDELFVAWGRPEISGDTNTVWNMPGCRALSLGAELFRRRFDEESRKKLGVEETEWPAAFAVLALGFLASAKAHDAEAHKFLDQKRPNWPKAAGELAACGAVVAQAAEAVAYAERLAEVEVERQQWIDLETSRRQAAAGQRRHSKIATLKAEFVEFYKAGRFPSKAQAARKFFASLPAERRLGVSGQEIIRTLTNALIGIPARGLPADLGG